MGTADSLTHRHARLPGELDSIPQKIITSVKFSCWKNIDINVELFFITGHGRILRRLWGNKNLIKKLFWILTVWIKTNNYRGSGLWTKASVECAVILTTSQWNLIKLPVEFSPREQLSGRTNKATSFPSQFKSRPLTKAITNSNSVPTTIQPKIQSRIVSTSNYTTTRKITILSLLILNLNLESRRWNWSAAVKAAAPSLVWKIWRRLRTNCDSSCRRTSHAPNASFR